MAREYARIRISIAGDGDVEALTPMAQWLYFRVLIADPKLSHCGVGDWRPKRLLGKARGLTLAAVLAAAAELEQTRFALFDDDTEEYLVRSYIRTEELMRNPKMAVAVGDAYLSAASRPLRAVIATEVLRDRVDHPEYSTWTHAISREVVELFSTSPTSDQVPYVDTFTNQIANGSAVLNGNHVGVQNGNAQSVRNTNVDPGAEYQCDSGADPLHLEPIPLQPAPMGGLVRTEVQQEPSSEPPPPPTLSRFCEEHPEGTSKSCLACRKARLAADRAELAHREAQAETARAAKAEATHEAAMRRAQAISDCQVGCDDDGYRNGVVCDHVDRTGVAARGRAAVLAELAKAKGGDA